MSTMSLHIIKDTHRGQTSLILTAYSSHQGFLSSDKTKESLSCKEQQRGNGPLPGQGLRATAPAASTQQNQLLPTACQTALGTQNTRLYSSKPLWWVKIISPISQMKKL